MIYRLAMAIVLSVLALPAVQQSVAGLSGDDIAGAPGFAVTLPIRLSTNGLAIAAIQFDVEFDPDSVSMAFALGDAAIDAVKSVAATDPATNPTRFIVYGLNRSVMHDGVLMNLIITVRSGVPAGIYPLRLTGVSAVDPDGVPVQITFKGGSFTVGTTALSIREMHTGNFVQGQTGAVYTILVSSNASLINAGAVVSNTVPAGLIATSVSGTGWSCVQPSGPCSRLDILAAGGSYPPIMLTVDVSRYAPATVMNRATVMGVGIDEVVTVDPTSISPYPQAPAQLVSGLTPAVNSGSSQTVTLTFNAPGGGQSLDVVNMLINTSLDGRRACYWAYVVPQQTLFLVDDEGDAAGPYQASVPGSSQPASNSQCTVSVVSAAGGGNGNGLTLVLNLSFSSSFAGNKTIYVAARDTGRSNSGWQIVGTQAVPPLPQAFPNPIGVSPSSGRNSGQTITVTYQDHSDAANLQTVWLLINSALDGRSACYVAYYRPANQVFLVPDSGDGSQAIGLSLTNGATISNSQCTISTQGAGVTAIGDTLSVSLPIAFKSSFAGFKGVWLAAQATGVQASMWQPLGVWTITSEN